MDMTHDVAGTVAAAVDGQNVCWFVCLKRM
jgi:hypothetical protein